MSAEPFLKCENKIGVMTGIMDNIPTKIANMPIKNVKIAYDIRNRHNAGHIGDEKPKIRGGLA